MIFSFKNNNVCGVLAAIIFLLAACDSLQSDKNVMDQYSSKKNLTIKVKVTNVNTIALQPASVYFSFRDLGVAVDSDQIADLSISENNLVQASQIIDQDGDGQVDGVLLVTDFAPAEIKHLVISSDSTIQNTQLSKPSKKQTQAEVAIKEGGEWKGKEYVGGSFKNVNRVMPPSQYTDHSLWIRYEGPGIESDEVAYRIYLDWRNGFDIFGKKTKEVVLQNVGLDGYDSYHEPADWGQDILKVGESLGMGGFGFWNGKKVELVSQVASREAVITNNGNLFSSFAIHYNGWQINNQTVNLKAHFSMTAASRLVHVTLSATQSLPNIAIGLVKHPDTELLQDTHSKNSVDETNRDWTYVASWGKQSLSDPNDYLGMAIFFKRSDRQLQTEDENSYVSVMNETASMDYYFSAVWDQDLGGIKTKEDFQSYLNRESERLNKAPRFKR